MEYFLYALFFISCIILVASVLLQPGKTDAGALFTSNVSSTAFGPRGSATILSKITIVTATIFMLSALMLSMPALTGERSVLSTNPEAPAETTSPVTQPPISDISTNSNGAANGTTENSNTASNTNAGQ